MYTDIYISYRNDGENFITAVRLSESLISKGYSVFFNSNEPQPGIFPNRLKDAIKNCNDFILIVSTGCLKGPKQNSNNDWVRAEILCAKENNKNIIPVLVNDVEWPASYEIAEDLKFIYDLDCIRLPFEYWDAAIQKLMRYLQSNLKKPLVESRTATNNIVQNQMAFPQAYNDDKPFIFISYAHIDKEIVYPFIVALQKRFNVWFDDGIHYGHEWEKEIGERLQKCFVFLFFVTENSLKSENCKDELYYARENKKHFVNLQLNHDVEIPGWFHFRYSRYQTCFLDTFSDYESAVEDLERKCEWFAETRITEKDKDNKKEAEKRESLKNLTQKKIAVQEETTERIVPLTDIATESQADTDTVEETAKKKSEQPTEQEPEEKRKGTPVITLLMVVSEVLLYPIGMYYLSVLSQKFKLGLIPHMLLLILPAIVINLGILLLCKWNFKKGYSDDSASFWFIFVICGVIASVVLCTIASTSDSFGSRLLSSIGYNLFPTLISAFVSFLGLVEYTY